MPVPSPAGFHPHREEQWLPGVEGSRRICRCHCLAYSCLRFAIWGSSWAPTTIANAALYCHFTIAMRGKITGIKGRTSGDPPHSHLPTFAPFASSREILCRMGCCRLQGTRHREVIPLCQDPHSLQGTALCFDFPQVRFPVLGYCKQFRVNVLEGPTPGWHGADARRAGKENRTPVTTYSAHLSYYPHPYASFSHCEEHFTERNETKQISTLSVYYLAVQTDSE